MVGPPLVVAIVRQNAGTFIKVNRRCNRFEVVALLAEALTMATFSDSSTVGPEDCKIPLFITLDHSYGCNPDTL